MRTLSLSPRSSSVRPSMAALASTLMVCWKEAAERKLSVLSAALVIPKSTGSAVAGSPPLAKISWLSFSKSMRSTSSPGSNALSPPEVTRTRRNIWRMITSMCLSLMVTP